jgi:hypothetical protein
MLTKASVDPHDTTLDVYSPRSIAAEFADKNRAAAVLGKLPYTHVPFVRNLPYITNGSTVDFYGEMSPISVSALGFGESIDLPRLRTSGILVVSNELLAHSQAAAIIEADLRRSDIEALDRRLLDPTSQGVDRIRPASITYGLDPVDATGAGDPSTVDGVVAALLGELRDAGSSLVGVSFITTVKNAIALSLMRDLTGARAYPTVSATGGTIAGLPLIVSASAPADTLIAVDASELLVADDSEVEIATSRFAVIDQDDAPVGNQRVNMYQTESTAIKLLRWINWSMRRPFVAYASNFALPLPGAS